MTHRLPGLAPALTRRRGLLHWAAACALLLGQATGALAEDFPSRPVRVYSPFPAGSAPDAVMRIVGEQLSAQWKQPVVVDNRPGANGFIALGLGKGAPPTGHELVMVDVGHMAINPTLFKKLPYDPKTDFAPVSLLFRVSFFVTVGSASKLQSFRDIVSLAQASPGKVSYGSAAVGGPLHLGGAQVEAATHTQMVHVPFKESSQLYTSIASEEVTWGLASIGSAGALLKSGKLRFVAIADSKRSPVLPNVPTIREAGGPEGIAATSWVALMAPRGTPPSVAQSISQSVAAVLKRPEVVERLANAGVTAASSTPAELAELIERDARHYAPLVRRTGASVD